MRDYFKEARKARNDGDYQKAGDLYTSAGDNAEAIEVYLEGFHFAHAARLYEKMEDWRNAAKYFGQASNFDRAANLYVKAEDYKNAGQMFEKSGDLARAADCAGRAGDFAAAASFADRAGQADKAADFYVKAQNYERAADIYAELQARFLKEKKEGEFLESHVVRIKKYGNSAGALYFRLQRFEKAAKCYEDADNLGKAAECFAKLNRFERAGELYAMAEDWANSSMMFEKAGKKMRALEVAEKGKDWARAAVLAEQFGQPDRAASFYFQAGKLDRAAELLFQSVIKAIDERSKGKLTEGQKAVLKKNASNAGTLYLQLQNVPKAAWCFEQGENFVKAAEAYALANNPAKAAEQFYRGKVFDKALDLYNKLPEAQVKKDILGEVYFGMGKFQEAAALFTHTALPARAAEAYAKAGDHYKAAVLYEEVNEFKKAADLYAKLNETKKAGPLYEKAGAWKEGADMYEQAGNMEKAAELLLKTNERMRSARLLSKLGNHQKALELIQQIGREQEEYLEGCALQGQILIQSGDDAGAIVKLKESIGNKSVSMATVEAYYMIAECHERKEQFANAQNVFEKILEFQFDYKDVLDRLNRIKERSTTHGAVDTGDHGLAAKRAQERARLLELTPLPVQPVAAPQPVPVSQPIPPSQPTAADSGSLVGKRIREYDILEVIGKGGMGSVYKARHIYLHKDRAIKVIEANPEAGSVAFERFIREARILSDLHNPHLVQLFEFGALDERLFFMVLEFIDGQSAKERVKAQTRIPIRDSVRIIGEAAIGLHTAHEKGIIHRDMSPDNIMLVKDSSGKEITKVIDFGIAKPLSEATGHYTHTNTFLGKPEFASPEQCGFMDEGETIDHRSDLYSLGITFYYMLTGKFPFYSPTPQGYLVKHVTEAPNPPSTHFAPGEFPPSLERVLLKMLAKKRNDRHATMLDFIKELNEAAAELQ